MNPKHKIMTASALALAITLGGGAILTGQAFAATKTATGATSSASAIASASTQSTTKGAFKGRGGDHGQRFKLDDAAIATLLGMTEADLETAEHAGKSLAAIAGEKGVAVQSVVDLVAKQLTASLDSKLAAGSITQNQYDTKKAKVATKAADLVNETFEGRGGHGGGRGGVRIDEAAIATLLGMTEADYETAEHAGKSMAALATEKGVALQSVIDLVTKQLTAALDSRLADGKITQSQYDTQKANVAAKATDIVNATHTGKGGHGSKTAKENAQTGTTANG